MIALLNEEEQAHPAVLREFQKYKASGMVFITEVVFAEASAGMNSAEELRLALNELGIADLQANDEGLFSAGQVFKEYRRSKGDGKKDGVLPDFMIGAVAYETTAAINIEEVCRYLALTVLNRSF